MRALRSSAALVVLPELKVGAKSSGRAWPWISPISGVMAGLAVAVTVGSPAQRVERVPVMPITSSSFCNCRATS